MPLTDNDTIKDRVRYAFEEYETEAEKYRNNCASYRDSSAEGQGSVDDDDEEDADTDLAEGGIMHLRTNIQTKQAFVTMADPDLRLEMHPDAPSEYMQIARRALLEAWRELSLTVLTKKAYVNRCVGGMGILTYRADENGDPEFDSVKKSDFAPDPHVTNWNRLRFASLKIKMPRDDFRERYPKYAALLDGAPKSGSGDVRRKNSIELKCYWDMATEAVMYNSTIIDKDANHYGKPPFLFLGGDLSPDKVNFTGDYENALGLQSGLSLLTEAVHNQARHGGGINLYNGDAITARKLKEGRQQGWIDTGAFLDRAIKRIEAEPLNPALLQAIQMEQNALDEATAVSSTQRGGNSDAKFATDIMVRANQSMARSDQERRSYELFCADVAKTLKFLLMEFSRPMLPEAQYVLEALESVTDIIVIERSTVFVDPTASRSDAKMLWDTSLQATDYGVPVDLQQMFLHFVRTHDIRDPERFLLSPEAQQRMMMQQMLAQSQPGASGGMLPQSAPSPAPMTGGMGAMPAAPPVGAA